MYIDLTIDTIPRNPAIAAIAAGGTKQSFLLWDKVYQKLSDEDDEHWLLRACDAALQYFANEFSKNEALRYVLQLLNHPNIRLVESFRSDAN